MNPLAIQAFVKSTGENALNARQVFETFDPDKGLVCKDSDQVSHFYIQNNTKISYFIQFSI